MDFQQLEPLAKLARVELVINKAGKAVLLHMGELSQDYSWIQYDDYTGTLQFITEEGLVQELGFVVPDIIKKALDHTREISIIEIDSEYNCKQRTLNTFNKVVH